MAQTPCRLDPAVSPRHLFGYQLRGWRERLGVSQAVLAGRLHVSKDAVTKWEKGIHLLNSDIATRLDALLGAGGLLLAAWQLADATRGGIESAAKDRPTVAVEPAVTEIAMLADTLPEDDAVNAAVNVALEFGSWAEQAGIGDVSLAGLHWRPRALATAALHQPPLVVLEAASGLCQRIFDLLRQHQRRPWCGNCT